MKSVFKSEQQVFIPGWMRKLAKQTHKKDRAGVSVRPRPTQQPDLTNHDRHTLRQAQRQLAAKQAREIAEAEASAKIPA